ncbi:MAG: hypothetical protein J4215_01710 [Candidatus Diapherotrites archaeon]|uniref:Uncharacterized protein n=1 Tax=Candidatus Iainarchaeum sp. TaxID=3101447 RepID=A0A8T4L6V4_9ARCH|nr:hypothetical protein [Candidatus Diapherotrites archaeon]
MGRIAQRLLERTRRRLAAGRIKARRRLTAERSLKRTLSGDLAEFARLLGPAGLGRAHRTRIALADKNILALRAKLVSLRRKEQWVHRFQKAPVRATGRAIRSGIRNVAARLRVSRRKKTVSHK